MSDPTSLEARRRSIINFKKRVQKKGKGEKGFLGYDSKRDFNELVEWKNR